MTGGPTDATREPVSTAPVLPRREPRCVVRPMPVRSASTLRLPFLRGWLARGGWMLLFAWLALRFWHPYYGLTQFLQIDALMAAEIVPALREAPIFIAPGEGSYDGGYYAQIATTPALDREVLLPAIDDAGYRARRILLGALAWVLGGGEAVKVVHVYAALNVALWFVLAVVLGRIFPADTARASFAWVALLFSAGVLFSVRLALTDLAALLLTAGAVLLAERGRSGSAAGVIGLAALTRETAVLALATLWSRASEAIRGKGRTVLVLLAALLPLTLWLLYVRHALGGSGTGQRNLTWPLAGWLWRWPELLGGHATTGNPLLVAECVLEHVALTVQAAYLLWRREVRCPWWRLGAAYLLLLVVMGHAVWGGFPNAATRVLLPLTLAFNVRAVRDRARWAWLVLGNLSILAGLHALWQPPGTPNQLPMPSSWSSRHLLETDARWSVAEWTSKHRWAWCAETGGLEVRSWPHRPTVHLALEVRGATPRELEVRHGGAVVWRGPIGDRPQWVTLPPLPTERGRVRLELHSPSPPLAEGADNTARRISFACFGARLVE